MATYLNLSPYYRYWSYITPSAVCNKNKNKTFFYLCPKQMHALARRRSLTTGGRSSHTRFVHRGRQRQRKMKAPRSSFKYWSCNEILQLMSARSYIYLLGTNSLLACDHVSATALTFVWCQYLSVLTLSCASVWALAVDFGTKGRVNTLCVLMNVREQNSTQMYESC